MDWIPVDSPEARRLAASRPYWPCLISSDKYRRVRFIGFADLMDIVNSDRPEFTNEFELITHFFPVEPPPGTVPELRHNSIFFVPAENPEEHKTVDGEWLVVGYKYSFADFRLAGTLKEYDASRVTLVTEDGQLHTGDRSQVYSYRMYILMTDGPELCELLPSQRFSR
jgi:hypothetical protein